MAKSEWKVVVVNSKGIMRKDDVVWMLNGAGVHLLCKIDSINLVPQQDSSPSTIVHMTEIENGSKHKTEHTEKMSPAVRMPEHKCYYPPSGFKLMEKKK